MERPAFVATGVPELDLILGGGLVQRSLVVLIGSAGSGKTVLAAQISWAIAARDERVLFVTAFSEPHDKLIINLRNFHFFEPSYVGGRIKLLNLQQQLSVSPDEAADTVVREAREHKAQLVVLDGFQGVRAASPSEVAPHQFLYDLSAKLSMLNVTAIVTHNVSPTVPLSPELTAGDGIVALSQELVGDQAIRVLQVIKQRGAMPLLGRHTFRITERGLVCYPRQEAVTELRDVAPGTGRATLGIPPLDDLLRGGLNEGTSTIVAGGEGVGKTLLGLQYVVQAVDQGVQALFISFHETERQLVTKGRQFGFDLQSALDSGMLRILHYAPAELNADIVAHELRTAVDAEGVQRVVIDGLGEIERPLIDRGRAHGFFASLLTFLGGRGVTTCITIEIDPLIGRELSFAGKSLSALADNVLLMQHAQTNGQPGFRLTILKMRFSGHDRMAHSYTIESNGINVSATPASGGRPARRRPV